MMFHTRPQNPLRFVFLCAATFLALFLLLLTRRAATFIFDLSNIYAPLAVVLLIFVLKIIFVKSFVKLFVKFFGFDLLLCIGYHRHMTRMVCFLSLLLSGCVSAWQAPPDFIYAPIVSGDYILATYQRLSDTTSPVHIYIEGDGNSFDAYGMPTSDPTPRGMLMRNLALRDTSPNVVYLARPCQYIMSPACVQTDWTNGRFSQEIIDSMRGVVKILAQNRPIILIGYSGGAMISGLIISQSPDMDIRRWITIAGVLNHADWTSYFGDRPLSKSLDMTTLPHVPQTHYIVQNDKVVPNSLSYKWADGHDITVIPNAQHSKIPDIDLDF